MADLFEFINFSSSLGLICLFTHKNTDMYLHCSTVYSHMAKMAVHKHQTN